MTDTLTRPTITDPREAALAFLRHYVHRGETEEELRLSHMGSWNREYRASIGGWAETADGERHSFPPTKVIVYQMGDNIFEQAAVFSLHEIYEALKHEIDGTPVQARLI